jgi:hypothetical protein
MPLHNSHIAFRRRPFLVLATYQTPQTRASTKIHFLQINSPAYGYGNTATNASFAPPYALSPEHQMWHHECGTKPYYQLGPCVPRKNRGCTTRKQAISTLKRPRTGTTFNCTSLDSSQILPHSLNYILKAPYRTTDLFKPSKPHNRTGPTEIQKPKTNTATQIETPGGVDLERTLRTNEGTVDSREIAAE